VIGHCDQPEAVQSCPTMKNLICAVHGIGIHAQDVVLSTVNIGMSVRFVMTIPMFLTDFTREYFAPQPLMK